MENKLTALMSNHIFKGIYKVAVFALILGFTITIFGQLTWLMAVVVYACYRGFWMVLEYAPTVKIVEQYLSVLKVDGKDIVNPTKVATIEAAALYAKDFWWMKAFRKIQGVGNRDSRTKFLVFLFGWSVAGIISSEIFKFHGVIIAQAVAMFSGVLIGLLHHSIQAHQLNKMRAYVLEKTGEYYTREEMSFLLMRFNVSV